MSQARRSRARALVRWREQVARLLQRMVPEAITFRDMGATGRSSQLGQLLDGPATFDVVVARELASRLIAMGEVDEIAHASWREWRQVRADRLLADGDRRGELLALVRARPDHPRTRQLRRQLGVARCSACKGQGGFEIIDEDASPLDEYESCGKCRGTGKQHRDPVQAFVRQWRAEWSLAHRVPCPRCVARSPSGAKQLATWEWGQAWSVGDVEGWRSHRPGALVDDSGRPVAWPVARPCPDCRWRGYFVGRVVPCKTCADYNGECPDCSGHGHIERLHPPNPTMGHARARLGRLLLGTLNGRWAPSECQAEGCDGGERQARRIGADGWNTWDCPDCRGTGHNLAGVLPPVEWSPQARHAAVDGGRSTGVVGRGPARPWWEPAYNAGRESGWTLAKVLVPQDAGLGFMEMAATMPRGRNIIERVATSTRVARGQQTRVLVTRPRGRAALRDQRRGEDAALRLADPACRVPRPLYDAHVRARARRKLPAWRLGELEHARKQAVRRNTYALIEAAAEVFELERELGERFRDFAGRVKAAASARPVTEMLADQ